MRALGRVSALALTALLCSACQLTPNFDTGYELDGPIATSPPKGALAVKRFDDARPARTFNTTARLFLLYIPLVPSIGFDFERLDESVQIISQQIEASGAGFTRGADQPVAPAFDTYTYPASFPRAIAADLNASGLFTAASYVGGEPVGDATYVLEGTLRQSNLHRGTTSFMLGMAGVLLWLVPVPMSRTSTEVVVDAKLSDAHSGAVVWQGTLDGELSRLITIYTSSAMVYGRAGAFSFNLEPPPSDARVNRRSLFSWHFGALRRAMVKARPEIAEAVARYQPKTDAKTSGATMVASDSIRNIGVSSSSLPQVIFSVGNAPE